MLFNSIPFFLFFICVYGLYLLLGHKRQNCLLIIASCFFYAVWSWKFLFVMFFSISIDYYCACAIDKTPKQSLRKFLLILSITTNLIILGFFKYFNFFLGNLNLTPLHIILPLGISFYTFEAISYIVDVYRRQVSPARNYFDYLLFILYFPHLIAGPIMRAKNFLPQITTPRKINLNQFYEGCFLFCWGLFEKMYVADNLAKIVNPIFAQHGPYEGSNVLFALYAFAFQIFCDFDGYSNMARGLGKCMGFEISINFNLPYFATNPQDFWRRWHITLSTWLRDYIYIPLGGNRTKATRTYMNLLLTMIIGGFWHGASWTFVIWGAYHGVLLVIFHYSSNFTWFKNIASRVPKLIKIIIMFHLTLLGWLFFRCASFGQALNMLHALFFNLSLLNSGAFFLFSKCTCIISPLLLIQVGQYWSNDLLFLYRRHWFIKIIAYAFLAYLVVGWGVMKPQEFFYFQF